MFSWMNFLIFALVILSSGYLMELSSNLFARRGGRNKTTPLWGSRGISLKYPWVSKDSSQERREPNLQRHPSTAHSFDTTAQSLRVTPALDLSTLLRHSVGPQRETKPHHNKQWGSRTPLLGYYCRH